MSTMLMIFGLATYSTKGVSFGGIESNIPDMIIPKLGAEGSTKFPTIILWAVAAVIIVWFIWNKTTFGKNLYAVGGNPVVGGVSFTGGIGKISGVVTGVFIFTALTYALTTLGIDANLQFIISGIIILVAVMLDCLKYVQKK